MKAFASRYIQTIIYPRMYTERFLAPLSLLIYWMMEIQGCPSVKMPFLR